MKVHGSFWHGGGLEVGLQVWFKGNLWKHPPSCSGKETLPRKYKTYKTNSVSNQNSPKCIHMACKNNLQD